MSEVILYYPKATGLTPSLDLTAGVLRRYGKSYIVVNINSPYLEKMYNEE